MSSNVSGKASESNASTIALVALVLVIFGGLTYIYQAGGGSKNSTVLSYSDAYRCMNGDGLNKMSDDEFELICLDNKFSVDVYPKGCDMDVDCELSLFNPKLPGFERSTLFEADLVSEIRYDDEKLKVSGVITGRGFLGQVEVDVLAQKVILLSEEEKALVEEARKPKVDPVVEAKERWLEERAADNSKMREYADRNDKDLRAKSTRVQVDQSSVNGLAEYRYYLKSGKVVSCLRGFEANVHIYECNNYNFN
ncbi:hypothetical protein [Pseudomonas sp.]|uniref:hypothetical protein n=1 Tax=Pseudomonas sp. TaxID=306 RepID=UPI003D6E94D4